MQQLIKQLQTAYENDGPKAVKVVHQRFEEQLMGQIEYMMTSQNYHGIETILQEIHQARDVYHDFILDVPDLQHRKKLEEEFQKEEAARKQQDAEKKNAEAAAKKAEAERKAAEDAKRAAEEAERQRIEKEAAELKRLEDEKKAAEERARQKVIDDARRAKEAKEEQERRRQEAETRRIAEMRELAQLRDALQAATREGRQYRDHIAKLEKRVEGTDQQIATAEAENMRLKQEIEDIKASHVKKIEGHFEGFASDPKNLVALERTLWAGFNLVQIFNFETLQRVSLTVKQGTREPSAMSIHQFADIEQTSELRHAFNQHRENGGKTPEKTVFPHMDEVLTPRKTKKAIIVDHVRPSPDGSATALGL